MNTQISFLNTIHKHGPHVLKVTRRPHTACGHYRLHRETQFEWNFAGLFYISAA